MTDCYSLSTSGLVMLSIANTKPNFGIVIRFDVRLSGYLIKRHSVSLIKSGPKKLFVKMVAAKSAFECRRFVFRRSNGLRDDVR